MTPDDLNEDWRECYEERAAIMEYDGGLSREQAEAKALACIFLMMSPLLRRNLTNGHECLRTLRTMDKQKTYP